MKRVLFSDLDGTLLDTADSFNLYLKDEYGLSIPDNVHHCGYSMQTLVLDKLPEDKRPTVEAFYEKIGKAYANSEKYHEDVVPVEGAVEAISALSQKYDIVVVTARQITSRAVTTMLLKKFFPKMIREIHFSYMCVGNGKFDSIPKVEFMERFHADRRAAFVDDSPHEISLASETVQSFLLDNRGFHAESPHDLRVTHWDDIAHRLL